MNYTWCVTLHYTLCRSLALANNQQYADINDRCAAYRTSIASTPSSTMHNVLSQLE